MTVSPTLGFNIKTFMHEGWVVVVRGLPITDNSSSYTLNICRLSLTQDLDVV